MKRVVLPLLPLALGTLLLSAVRYQAPARQARRSLPPAPSRHTNVASGNVVDSAIANVDLPARRDDDRAAVRRKIRDGEASTYISDILHERDSSLARWADRNGVPLTVWIQQRSKVADFTPSFAAQVRDAFQEWGALNLPVRFSFVHDSADAEVHVSWIDRFTAPISGRTRWSRDDDWFITDANITLAVHHTAGELLDDESTHALALHEIGHLLGLDHTRDTLSIMAAKVRVRNLSAADAATARLLYALPAGPIR
jgi:hypothetical protein